MLAIVDEMMKVESIVYSNNKKITYSFSTTNVQLGLRIVEEIGKKETIIQLYMLNKI